MTLNVPEAKCRLHIAMRDWPTVDDATARYLRLLHWRIRRVVELTHGEGYSGDQVAAQLRISTDTVYSDLSRAYVLYQERVPEM